MTFSPLPPTHTLLNFYLISPPPSPPPPTQIDVFAVHPGLVDSPLMDKADTARHWNAALIVLQVCVCVCGCVYVCVCVCMCVSMQGGHVERVHM